MGLERDVDVAFLGNAMAPRRQRLLPGLFNELAERGIQVVAEDHIYGDARNELLNRTRILLNVLRAPQDFVGQRFLLGSANKALVISEPVRDSSPFVPGQHIVVASLDRLADEIEFYLSNESRREEIADRAYRFVCEELAITKMVGLILAQARASRGKRVLESRS
jgi:spore maturation protein CgeB